MALTMSLVTDGQRAPPSSTSGRAGTGLTADTRPPSTYPRVSAHGILIFGGQVKPTIFRSEVSPITNVWLRQPRNRGVADPL